MNLYNLSKRAIDLSWSLLGLCLLSPVLALISLIIKIESRGPVIFRQERMGREGRPFQIFKFRSMKTGGEGAGLPLTVDGDPRITRAGRFLRRFKLDELPQLFNVVRGDMSLVGPRPEVRKYVNLFEEDYREILTVRPGMTDFASLEFRDENERLQASEDPEGEYLEKILPEKIDLYKKYLRERSLRTDLALIFRTVWTVVAK